MTDDELRLNLESLHASCHELFESTQRLEHIAVATLESIKGLERIATAHQDRLDDHEQRIEDLEDK